MSNKVARLERRLGVNGTLYRPVTVNSILAISSAVEAGLAYGIMPIRMTQNKIATGELVQIAEEVTLTDTVIYLVYPSRRGRPAKINTMVSWSEQIIENN